MMDQMLSDIHVVGIKWNTTQPMISDNSVKIRIMIELLTEDVQFQVLSILSLEFQSSGKFIFYQL